MNAPITIGAVQWDGRQITQPGIYAGVPIERYHHDPDLLDGPSISSSGLRRIGESPAAYWIESPYNPHRIEQPQKPALNLGRAAHTLLLGEGEFATAYAVRPDCWDSWRTKDAKAWRDDAIAAGLTVLEPSDIELIRGMAGLLPWQQPSSGNAVPESGLANSRYVSLGILEGDVEQTIVHRDAETGIWIRVRPDVIPRADGVVADLKTIGHGTPSRTIWDRGYHQQAALAADAMRIVAGIEVASSVLVFVQSKPPFRVSIHELDTSEDAITGEPIDPLAIASALNRKALRTFARCLAEKSWPAADGEPIRETMPPWIARAAMGLAATDEAQPQQDDAEEVE